MKRFFNGLMTRSLVAVALMAGMSACSDDKDEVIDDMPPVVERPVGDKLAGAIDGLDGLVTLGPDILGSEWDEGYIGSDGYILARGLTSKEAMAQSRRMSRTDVAETPALSYLTADKTLTVHVFFGDDGLPSQIAVGDNVLYFNFLNDEVLELVLSAGGTYSYQTTVGYNREALLSAVDHKEYQFFFQRKLAAIVALLDGADIPAEYASVIAKFKAICMRTLASDPDATLQNLIKSGLVDQKGNAEFVTDMTDSFEKIVVKVHYSIMLWTGKASFKVGGTSCTLSGTIHCASEDFDTYGTYGIVCDTDIDNLTVDKAEYAGAGKQQGVSTHFDVDFRGLKANTTYYYRAYYKFNSADHGGLSFRYGDPDAEIAYDSVIKEFTTGDNILTVDVVMCIDVTGSMSDIINTVKSNAMTFYDSFNDKCVKYGIQLAGLNSKVIAFQDINVDGDRWWSESRYYSLPAEREHFDSFVSALYADGGGDTPESGLEALDGAFKALEDATDDGYHRQVVILWTDAPYLTGEGYTALRVDDLQQKWNTLSTGRRLILFAPEGDYDSNGGDWNVFNSWKNVIHATDISASFSDFDYILESIIDELIGRGDSKVMAPARKRAGTTRLRIRANR